MGESERQWEMRKRLKARMARTRVMNANVSILVIIKSKEGVLEVGEGRNQSSQTFGMTVVQY